MKSQKILILAERCDIILEWFYICHRTLSSNQAAVVIKPETPKKQMDKMPDKVIVCHRCKNVMSNTKKIPSQAFLNKLYPDGILDVLKCLTSMEIRLIQRMINTLHENCKVSRTFQPIWTARTSSVVCTRYR